MEKIIEIIFSVKVLFGRGMETVKQGFSEHGKNAQGADV